LFEELKQRNVFKAGAAYALIAWLLLQLCSIAFPSLLLPDWSLTLVTVLLALGFPVVLVLAWAFDLTPDGVKAESTKVPLSLQKFLGSRQIDFVIIGLLGVAVIFLIVDQYVLTDEPPIPDFAEDAQKSIAVLPFVTRRANSIRRSTLGSGPG